jgi:ABC-2 type transport system permease protein
MSKVGLIIGREYLTRVKKKSFLIMTIVGPLLMAGLIFSRVWMEMIPEDPVKVAVADESGLFVGKLEGSKTVNISYMRVPLDAAKVRFLKDGYDALLYIPSNVLSGNTAQFFYHKQPSTTTQSFISKELGSKLEELKLLASGIDRDKLAQTRTRIHLLPIKIRDSGTEETDATEMKILIAFLGGALIYLFIFLYGSQVMRGVIEEKSSRIVEVIVSSVKPFELMMGKIVGIALVGLTQFVLWVVLTFGVSTILLSQLDAKKYASTKVEQTMRRGAPVADAEEFGDIEASALISQLGAVDFITLLSVFLVYFIGGYLLYGSLFAAVGSAVDSEADTQQFILPLTIPLLLSFVALQTVMTNPESPIAYWFSLFPLTSPVVMMGRIPFGVPIWQVALSMALLIAGFLFTTWMAGRIYRTGILMYGKKASWRELMKWMWYKA